MEIPSSPPSTIEEELEILSQYVEYAEQNGFEPFPEKPERPIRKWALGFFLVVMMVSWTSQALFRYL